MRRVYGDLKGVERAAVGAWPGDVDRSGPHVFYIQLGHRTWIYSTNNTCTMNEITCNKVTGNANHFAVSDNSL